MVVLFRSQRKLSPLQKLTQFATAERARTSDPVYGMVQCRNHLSSSNCVSCFTTGVAQISRCSEANGARVIYDGCFLSGPKKKSRQQAVAGDKSRGLRQFSMKEIERMKEISSKLLLGEESGSGKGVSTALAISNAITNLSGFVRISLLFFVGTRLMSRIGK